MEQLRLPRIISDGMILQQKKSVRIWGFDEPGRKVMVSFLGEEYVGMTQKDGMWEVGLSELAPGGPHTMHISDNKGNEVVVADILVGDVWICAGQSNMELPMDRVKDQYPKEVKECTNSEIRTFKITEHGNFHGSLVEHLSGEWKSAKEDTILQFSATAYFFAKQLYQMTGVPVGLINASLGGSRIESWMSKEMLSGYDEEIALAKRYADDDFVQGILLQNQQQTDEWHRNLDSLDAGLKEHWEQANADASGWEPVQIPFFFRDTKLNEFIGSVWFKREFQVPSEMAGKEAKLWLGTIVDSDTAYINGQWVGHTDYQYPPRKYQVPEGLLVEGTNTIVIHVKCENGHGRFTPDKRYAIWNDQGEIDLKGQWSYKVGAICEQIKPTDFVNWKPTGLFNGMMAPSCKYSIAGFLWYQGESNTHVPWVYLDLLKRMISGYRKCWQDETLPFFYVQLPNFSIDVYDSDEDETGQGWPAVRELQRQALSIPETGMVVAIDLGEDNDLHPLNKEDVGSRLSLLAAKKLYGIPSECEGPQIDKIERVNKANKQGCQIEISCHNISDGMYAFGREKGNDIIDFELQDESGNWYLAKAEICQDKICVWSEELAGEVTSVRYCYASTNKGALIYNRAGFPMSPFQIDIHR